MRFIFYFILFSSLLRAQTKTGRKEITPFIISSVILTDTTQIRHVNINDREMMTIYDYSSEAHSSAHFLSPEQFSVFEACMWSVVRSPKSKVYMYLGEKPLPAKALGEHVITCDTMITSTYDFQGDEVLTTIWACDTLSKMHSIRKIEFFETWYFNPSSNLIEKEILGYCAWRYDWDMEAYRTLFYVFRDQATADKAKL